MIELKNKHDSNEYQFTLKAENGQIIFHSSLYPTKRDALDGISLAKDGSPDRCKYERKTATNGKFYFNLKSSTNQIIGASQLYTSESGMENGIKNVKEHIAIAQIKEI